VLAEPSADDPMMLRSSNLWFFLILSLNFWLVPFLCYETAGDLVSDGLLALTLLAAVALQGLIEKRFRLWALAAGLCIIAAITAEEMMPGAAFIENATFAACFAAATTLYFHIMIRSLDRVTFDTVFAAACTYVLIGMFFAAVFGLVLEADPLAFEPGSNVSGRYDLLYYSFSTLTTLGPADILPASDAAKMLTVFEATIGLIYIAVLVGAVVGTFSAGIVAGSQSQGDSP